MRIFASAAAFVAGIALIANAEAPVAADTAKADPAAIKRPDVQAMSIAQIRKFNTTLPSKHPYFIVCRQSTVTGSLAQVKRVCQTREDWERRAREAQDATNGLVEGGRASSGCNPYCGGKDPT